METKPAAGGQHPGPAQTDNTVLLRGRVSGKEEQRELPSGDHVRMLRVVVPRPPRRGRAAAVDTIDVACWSASTRRVADRVDVGECVAVSGSLRRRFFKTGAGVTSRYEVEAASLQRVATG